MTDQLKKRLTSDVYDNALSYAQQAVAEGNSELRVDGQMTVDVNLIVSARVTIPFEDILIAEHEALELKVDDDGYHIVVRNPLPNGREKIDTYELGELIEFTGGFDPKDAIEDLDEDDFDYFEVVRVDDIDIDDVRLNDASENARLEWNTAAEEE